MRPLADRAKAAISSKRASPFAFATAVRRPQASSGRITGSGASAQLLARYMVFHSVCVSVSWTPSSAPCGSASRGANSASKSSSAGPVAAISSKVLRNARSELRLRTKTWAIWRRATAPSLGSPAWRVSPCRRTSRYSSGPLLSNQPGRTIRQAAGSHEPLGAPLPVMGLGGAIIGAGAVGDPDSGLQRDARRPLPERTQDVSDAAIVNALPPLPCLCRLSRG